MKTRTKSILVKTVLVVFALCMLLAGFLTLNKNDTVFASANIDVSAVEDNWIDTADTTWYNTENTEFTIDTAVELAGLASLVNSGNTFENKKITLGANIDLAGKNWISIGYYGSDSQPVFSGEFDGNGKTISNLVDATDTVTKGFFGYANKSYIHNFTLENVYFSGETNSYVGSVVAMAYSYNVIKTVTVDTVTYALTTSGGNVGGMVGYSYESYVKNCTVKNATFDITTTASTNIGGVVAQGRGTAHDIENFAYKDEIDTNDQFVYNGETPTTIYNYCDSKVEKLTVNVTGTSIIGGFLGTDGYSNWGNYSKECSVTDLDVTCDGEAAYYVGGYMGKNAGADYGTDYGFVDCEVSGKITGNGTNADSFFGGFVGFEGGRASDYGKSTAAVDIKAKAGNVGGFTGGMQQYSTFAYSFVDCIANGNVSTENGVAGGFIGILKDYDAGQDINVTLYNCKAYGKVSGSTYAGGLWGYIDILEKSTTTDGIILTKDCTPATDIKGKATNSIVNLPKKYYVDTSDTEKYTFGDSTVYTTVNGLEIGYESIQAAVDAGVDNISLLADSSENVSLENTTAKSFAFNDNGFTFSGNISNTNDIPLIYASDYTKYYNGNGELVEWYNETGSEFTIYTAGQLAALAQLVNNGNKFINKTFILANDIDLNNMEWTPIGKDKTNYFQGNLNGNGHTIYNLKISSGENAGLFGYIQSGSAHYKPTIENLTICNVDISGVTNGGAFEGTGNNTANNAGKGGAHIFNNIKLTGLVKIEGENVGGIIGGSWADYQIQADGITVDVEAGSYVKGSKCAGGVFGSAPHATVSNVISNIDVIGLVGAEQVGGIAGNAGWTWNDITYLGNVTLNVATVSEKYSAATIFGNICENSYWGTSDYTARMFNLNDSKATLKIAIDGGETLLKNGHPSNVIGGTLIGSNEFNYIDGGVYDLSLQVGENKYYTIAQAIRETTGDITIELLKYGNLNDTQREYNIVIPEGRHITIDLGGGQLVGNIINNGVTGNLTIKSTSTANEIVMDEPINGDKVFYAWYSDADFGNEISITNGKVSTLNESGITFYALYYDSHITFDGNGYIGRVTTQWDNDGAQLSKNTFARTGYKFNGWNTQADGKGTHYNDGAVIDESLHGKITLYAEWTPIKYIISFDGNNEYVQGTMDTVTATYDVYLTLSEVGFTHSQNQDFVGWAYTTGAGDTGMIYANDNWVVNLTAEEETITLYAIWTTKKVHAPQLEQQKDNVYDGKEKSFVLKNADGNFTITYLQNGIEVTPIDAGTYDVKLDCEATDEYAAYHNTIMGGLYIAPKQIENIIWSDDTLTYNGKNQDGVIKATYKDIDDKAIDLIVTLNGDSSFVNAGEYTFTASFANAETNYKLPSDATKNYTIAKAQVKKPEADTTTYIYNGEEQTYLVHSSAYYTITGIHETNAGTYDVIISLDDKNNYEWTNGGTDNVVFEFVIEKQQVAKPNADTKTFTYNGLAQTYTLDTNALYTISGNVQTYAGNYTVTVALVDNNNYKWADGNSDNLSYEFVIGQKEIGLDWSAPADLVYSGSAKVPTVSATSVVSDDTVNVEIALTADNDNVNVGTFAYYATGLSNANYKLPANVTSGSYTIIAKDISSAEITLGNSLTYTGTEQTQTVTSVVVDGLDVTYAVTGNTATNVKTDGTYTLTVTGNGNFTGTATKAWNIAKQQVAKPTADTTVFTYNGSEQTYTVVTNNDYSVSGNTRKDAGSQNVTISLNDTSNYEWTDGTTTDVVYTFTIAKANANIIVDTTAIVKSYGETWELPVANSNFGTVVCDKVITDLVNAGTYTVTYTVAGTSNYNGDTKTVNVTINKATFDMTAITFTDKTVKYDGQAQSIEIVGTLPNGVTVAYTNNGQTEVGEYTITATFTYDTANYNVIEPMTAVLTINSADFVSEVDEETGKPIAIIESENGFAPDVEVSISEVDTKNVETGDSVKENEIVVKVVDISLTKDGNVLQPNGVITIKLLIPTELDGKEFRLIHNHEGTFTDLEYTVENGYAVFSTSELSQFLFVRDDTANLNWLIWVLSGFIGLMVILAITFFIVIKKKGGKAKRSTGGIIAACLSMLLFRGSYVSSKMITTLAVLGTVAVFSCVLVVVLGVKMGKTLKACKQASISQTNQTNTAEPVRAVEENANQTVTAISETAVTESPAVSVNNGTEIVSRYNRSFMAKLIQAPEETKEFFAKIRNYLLSFKGVKCRISWKTATFNIGRKQIAKLTVKGKTLNVNLALNPADYTELKFKTVDKSESKTYANVPLGFKVKSNRGVNNSMKLIDDIAKALSLVKKENNDIVTANSFPFEDINVLIEKGLIKVKA